MSFKGGGRHKKYKTRTFSPKIIRLMYTNTKDIQMSNT